MSYIRSESAPEDRRTRRLGDGRRLADQVARHRQLRQRAAQALDHGVKVRVVQTLVRHELGVGGLQAAAGVVAGPAEGL